MFWTIDDMKFWCGLKILTFACILLISADAYLIASELSEYKIRLPYSIEVSKTEKSETIEFQFVVCDAEITLGNVIDFETWKHATEEKVANVIGNVGLTLPLILIFPKWQSQTIGKNRVSVKGSKIIAKRNYISEKIYIIINGQDMGVMETDDNGKIILKDKNSGVYELVTDSVKEGLSLSKQFFIE